MFKHFITTIAYHISLSIPTSQPLIQHALQQDPIVPSHSMEDQLWEVVAEPFGHVAPGTKPFVVVVNALNECDDRKIVCKFINLLAETCSDYPLRFLLVS